MFFKQLGTMTDALGKANSEVRWTLTGVGAALASFLRNTVLKARCTRIAGSTVGSPKGLGRNEPTRFGHGIETNPLILFRAGMADALP